MGRQPIKVAIGAVERRVDGGTVSRLPIADYAVLSDCHSAALVSRDGSIDWLCFPRFDSPSVFGRILDDAAGHWSISPAGGTPFETTRRYVDDTLLLETTFTTADGSVTMTDAMAVGRNERGHALGAGAVGTVLRRLVGVEGEIELELEYAPRPEYGLVAPALYPEADGLTARGGASLLRLSSPVPLELDGSTARARFSLRAGDTLVVRPPPPDDVAAAAPRLDAGEDRRATRRHRRGLAHLVQPPPELRRAVGRPRQDERPGAVRADVLPDGRDRGRADDVAPGGAWPLTKLGLPLHVGT